MSEREGADSGQYSFGSFCVDMMLLWTFLLIVWASYRSLGTDTPDE